MTRLAFIGDTPQEHAGVPGTDEMQQSLFVRASGIMVEQGCTLVLTTLDSGFCQAAALAAADHGIPFVLAAVHPDPPKDVTTEERRVYQGLVARAMETHALMPDRDRPSNFVIGMRKADRNMWLLSRAEKVVIFGRQAALRSEARSRNTPIVEAGSWT